MAEGIERGLILWQRCLMQNWILIDVKVAT